MSIIKNTRGFTIVELLIIISVIGILSAVALVGWSAIVTKSQNETRKSELLQWKSTFELYKSRFATYPSPSAPGQYCVGGNFASDQCGANGSISENTTLNAQLQRVTKLPTGSPSPVKTIYIGPFVAYGQSTATSIVLTGVFQGSATDCPSETVAGSSPTSGVIYCTITLQS